MEGRYEELSIRITLPEVIQDAALLQKLMREHNELMDCAEFAREFRRKAEAAEGARRDAGRPGAVRNGPEELDALEPELDALTREARLRLLPKDPDDYRNAILEVRAGAGGDEAGLFGAELLRMYTHYAESRLEGGIDRGRPQRAGRAQGGGGHDPGRNVFSRLKYETACTGCSACR